MLWTAIFCLEKPVFLLVHAHGLTNVLAVVAHGLSIDFSLAGYLSAVPFLLLAFGGWLPERVWTWAHRVYYGLAALAVSLSFVANLCLYSFWHFPLDATPLFYFLSSPADALASVPWWWSLLALVVVAALAGGIWLAFRWLYGRFGHRPERSWRQSLVMVVLTAALFLPIRGGVTVSTTNTGKAYFSTNTVLNHAAVNPLFSFLESMAHQEDFDEQYRFMSDEEARRLVSELNRPDSVSIPEPVQPAVRGSRPRRPHLTGGRFPDVYLIIMESFSDTVMRQPDVTPNLLRLSRTGWYFSHFYANSFRTDRGLLSILQGFPAPATVSLMKFPKKTAVLPSICGHLKRAGYLPHYYYGGDADFMNMRSFLVNQGFANITEDVDFPVADRLSKWGVPDHLLFRRVERDLRQPLTARPVFRVIQTSSSHEPFDVPYHRLHDTRLNAFAYADSCVGSFVKHLQARPERWRRSLVILVPDHLGAWPDNPDDFKPWRFHVPMIWVGGALGDRGEVETLGSQQDIAATLLGLMGLPHNDMPFSKDLLNPAVSHYAFFMMHDGEGLLKSREGAIVDNRRKSTVWKQGSGAKQLARQAQAYVQRLYDRMAEL